MIPDQIGCREAEAAFLGCLLRSPRIFQIGFTQQADVDDFTDPRHRLVFEAIDSLVLNSMTADPVTVLGELRRTGSERSFLADKNAGVFLVELCEAAPAHGSIGHYLLVVLEHRARRRFAEAGKRLEQEAGTAALVDLQRLLADEYVAVSSQVQRVEDRRVAEMADHEAVA